MIIFMALTIGGCGQKERRAEEPARTRCLEALNTAAACPDFWVRVHAVEFLADLGYTGEARRWIEDSLAAFDTVPQKRIGLWRSLYRVAQDTTAKAKLLGRIAGAYMDRNGPDRVHAAETLSKLGYPMRSFDRATWKADLEGGGALASYLYWGLSLPAVKGDAWDYGLLWKALASEEPGFREAAAYALTFADSLPPDRWRSLRDIALVEPPDSPARPYLLAAAYTLAPDGDPAESEAVSRLKKKLFACGKAGGKTGRIELCRAMARKPDPEALPLLRELLELKDPLTDLPVSAGHTASARHPWNLDVQAAAAYALLKQAK